MIGYCLLARSDPAPWPIGRVVLLAEVVEFDSLLTWEGGSPPTLGLRVRGHLRGDQIFIGFLFDTLFHAPIVQPSRSIKWLRGRHVGFLEAYDAMCGSWLGSRVCDLALVVPEQLYVHMD